MYTYIYIYIICLPESQERTESGKGTFAAVIGTPIGIAASQLKSHSCSWGHYDSTMHCNIVIDALQDSPWSEGKVSIHSLQSLYEETSGPARKDFLGCCNVSTMNF